ncbi:MAG: gluconate 2-dehydrogenase subunit 3 family protein [Myxococcota bacterium]|nr:gluconate 2-dehydrogenase subunit 3 family protein [Myxococcota bacterium]
MSLDAATKRTLAAVLDRIVPPGEDGRLPGAGELGLADFVEENLRARPELRPVLEEGLARLDEEARARAGRPFAALEPPAQREALDAAAAALPAFFGPLLFQTYVGYYRHPQVLEALGLEPRPPYPLGFQVPATDFRLLEPVRRRKPLYRVP